MTHSRAHGDGRGSNKRMRSLGNQDLDTGGVDSGYVGSAKVRETLRLPSPRSQCGPCPPAAAVPCAGLRQRAKLSRIPAKPVLPPARPACPGWGAKQLCNATRGHRTLHHVNWRTEQHQLWFNGDIYTHRLCVDINSIDICLCDSL